ncbi:MAG: tandem-95 repeat protein [Xanthomonadales bacterium]|nr:tandem-95 repeat protein [Xanthomonadales bacterium]
MKRILLSVACCLLTLATAQAQMPGQPQPGEGASVAHAIPLSYVGGSGRVSIGIDDEGNSTGEAMGVFDNTGEHAYIGQLWWGDGGAGGVQMGYNWLWGGMTLSQASEHPDKVTVARTMVAVDQNAFKDRKATFGFGIERPDYFIDAYLSAAASGSRNGGARSIAAETVLHGSDEVGSYTQVETVTTIEGFASRAYDHGIGVRAGHFSDLLAARVHAGMDYQRGSGGAHVLTTSVGVDKYLGTRGWSLSGLVEHDESSTDPLLGTSSDTRTSLFLRYEFGGRVFVPTSELASPAWISRAMVNPPSAHPRTVQTYTRRTTRTSETEVGPRHYTNLNPIAVDDSASVAAGAGTLLIDVLANDSDGDGDPLSLTAVGPAAHGATTLAGNHVAYTPAADFTGSDTFPYTIGDGRGGTASASVTVTVTAQANRPPLARDDTASTRAGVPVGIDVLANDADPDGDPITVASLAQPANGTATLGGDGHITYTPAAGFDGSDGFGYTIEDGRGGSASARVSITVTPAPNRPPVARDDSAMTPAGIPVVVDVLANDSDPDGDPIAVSSLTQPAHGTAALGGDGRVSYTPAAGFDGSDTFGYTIEDGRGGSASARVSITVTPAPNRPPVAMDDSASVAAVGGSIDVDVLANDSDPDGDPLSVVTVSQGQYGSAAIQPDGRVRYIWTDPAASGSDQFTYTIEDGRGGSASATVQVSLLPPPNRSPVAMDDSASVAAGSSVDVDVLANDSDPDGDPLSVVAVSQGQYGSAAIQPDGRVRYTWTDPAASGSDQFTYTIEDGRGGSASATVQVSLLPPPNRPPVAVDDIATVPADGSLLIIPVLANDSDPDDDPLAVISVTTPLYGNVAILANGTLAYSGAAGLPSMGDSFAYTISDGRGGEASAMVTVLPANRPPLAADDEFMIPLNPNGELLDVLANDNDPDGDPLQIVALTQPDAGSVLIEGNQVRFIPADYGEYMFTYTIDDGRGGTATASVSVVVYPP